MPISANNVYLILGQHSLVTTVVLVSFKLHTIILQFFVCGEANKTVATPDK